MQNIFFVLGAADPEMRAIERLLSERKVQFMHASIDGKRVYPANAYRAQMPQPALEALRQGGKLYLVECIDPAPPGALRIDHHRPGDPGYGHPPGQYWEASSLGQTVAALESDTGVPVGITPEMRMLAAADHCLGAAYRGECPGVEPDALMHWHIASRARYEKRPQADVQADVEATRKTLRTAPRVELAPGLYAADVRGLPAAELPLAAARDAQCCLSAVRARDGRTKIGCLVGTPRQISAFMQVWAPAHGLVDGYGDPVRGFAGAYLPRRARGDTRA